MKFGQLLSTRPDVVPPDIIAELRGLQDDVRPFPFEQAGRVIEEDLGNTLERLFLDFDQQPVAAASIGQVHRAILPNGRHVAVKVQRPGAPDRSKPTSTLLYQAAKLVKERIRALDFVDAHQSSTSSRARSARARLPARGAERADLPPQLRGSPPRARAEGLLAVHARARADARVDRRDTAGRRRRLRHDDPRGAARPRVPDRRDVDDDDLPARFLPRRSTPRQRPPADAADRSGSSTSVQSGSSPTTTCRR